MSLPAPRHWALGLALSLAAAWLAGAVFLDTVQPMAFDAALGRYVATPGTTSRTRGEGWASSSVGEHGIRGLPGGRLPEGPQVAFWGDSFVEGLQVDDHARMAQQFSELAASAGLELAGRKPTGVGLGTGGDHLPDFLLKARDTAPALGDVRLHVFVLPRMADILPDVPSPGRASFRSLPQPRLEEGGKGPSDTSLALAPAFRSLELAGAFAVYERLRALSVRLAPGPVLASAASSPPATRAADETAMRFLIGHALQTARENGGGEVLFLRLPTLPRLESGTVAQGDPEEALARAFAEACGRGGAAFLDMGPTFRSFHQQTGRFPSGLFNSPPGSGHLNEDGHRLVARAVVRHIQEHPDALLAR